MIIYVVADVAAVVVGVGSVPSGTGTGTGTMKKHCENLLFFQVNFVLYSMMTHNVLYMRQSHCVLIYTNFNSNV